MPDLQKINEFRVLCIFKEINQAEFWLIKLVQKAEFSNEIKSLLRGEPVHRSSKLSALNCFVDENNIIRVGGRLKNLPLSKNKKYPIVLPSKHVVTLMIIKYYHAKYLHVGSNNLLYHVRQKYWPLNGRNLTRQVVHKCVICFKKKKNPILSNQLMGDLPKERVTPSYPFNNCGVDFCGPFMVKFKNQRKGVLNKVYVSIFVCQSTKAINLDFVSDLTSKAFIACLKRFFGRGKSSKMFSDNGKTFVRANIELKKLHDLVKAPDETLVSHFNDEHIDWNFIPPRSLNFGGLWESGVKSFKTHLKRVAGSSNLTLEEFITLLAEIEALLIIRDPYHHFHPILMILKFCHQVTF
ncbi:integrase catalytic domain-containing protein [Trichonephila clavipes]|uniref:Integrase catalytic domain-containing protein n=1 Tax=Trichonephila clavipes TaxID=2585209 RepID=A0A8X6SIS8_TRICX|nr:integrase catalytic domain-containing protein [Trichonephila clavipes]